LKAESESLPYWQEIIKRFPQSPRCEPAFYNAGVILSEMAAAAPSDKAATSLRKAGKARAAIPGCFAARTGTIRPAPGSHPAWSA
jgi:hypothetical protein